MEIAILLSVYLANEISHHPLPMQSYHMTPEQGSSILLTGEIRTSTSERQTGETYVNCINITTNRYNAKLKKIMKFMKKHGRCEIQA